MKNTNKAKSFRLRGPGEEEEVRGVASRPQRGRMEKISDKDPDNNKKGWMM